MCNVNKHCIGLLLFSSILFLISGNLLLGCAETPIYGKTETRIRWVNFETEAGEEIKALYGEPGGQEKRPAVIFNHGTDVRMRGYQGAVTEGKMDVRDFVEALVRNGYIALAPIRTFEQLTAQLNRGKLTRNPGAWIRVVEGGLRVVPAALEFISSQSRVAQNRIALVGFSEGGLITLWSLIEGAEVRAGVLIAPANIPPARHLNLENATRRRNLKKINVPVFLALAQSDFPGIMKQCHQRLIPHMEELDKDFQAVTYYLGGHGGFMKVRPRYWNDITTFLAHHLNP